jgi:hypothetical protein
MPVRFAKIIPAVAAFSYLAGLLAAPVVGQTDASQRSAAAQSESSEKPIPADALKAAIRSGRAIPNEHGITIVLAGGKHIDFQDKTIGCPSGARQLDDANCQHFVLAADLPSKRFFLIRRQDYEGGVYFLVDDHTGRQTEIDAVPVFSPDGSRFLVQNDNVATYHENNLEIWRREGDTATIEWSHPYKQVYAEAPVLKGIYHIEVTGWHRDRITLAFSSGQYFDTKKNAVVPARYWIGSLTRQGSGWRLKANCPKGG